MAAFYANEQRKLVESPGDRPGLELLEAQSATSGHGFAIYRIKG